MGTMTARILSGTVKGIEKLRFVLRCIYRRKYRRLRWLFDDEACTLLQILMNCDSEAFEVVIDGGANHGLFSKAVLNISPRAQVLGIEPLITTVTARNQGGPGKACLRDLQRVKARYSPRFNFVGYALSDHEGLLTFYSTEADGCSSLLKPPEDPSVPDFNVVSEDQVRAITLDNLVAAENITRVDLLKLDLQGAEMQALRGATDTLDVTQHILLELNLRRVYKDSATANEITEFLADRGFLFRNISNLIRTPDGAIAQCDAFFSRANEGGPRS